MLAGAMRLYYARSRRAVGDPLDIHSPADGDTAPPGAGWRDRLLGWTRDFWNRFIAPGLDWLLAPWRDQPATDSLSDQRTTEEDHDHDRKVAGQHDVVCDYHERGSEMGEARSPRRDVSRLPGKAAASPTRAI